MNRLVWSAALCLVASVSAVADDKALKELDGEYTLKALEENGKPAPDEAVKAVKLVTFKDGVMTVALGEREEKAKITVDAAKSPAEIDLTPEGGSDKGKTLQGIYKLDKDTLTIVMSEKGTRPKELKSAGEGTVMLVLAKKAK